MRARLIRERNVKEMPLKEIPDYTIKRELICNAARAVVLLN